MKLARPILAAVTVGVVLAVVFTVFAIELASAQNRARNEIKTEVKDRAELTAALMNSLFGTLEINETFTRPYGDSIDSSALATQAQQERYAAVTDSSGGVLQGSQLPQGMTRLSEPANILAELEASYRSSRAQKKSDAVYYLGNLDPYPGGGYVADLIVPFPAQHDTVRLLVTGLNPSSPVFKKFFGGNIRTVPGVKGEVNYYVDGNGKVIAASNDISPGSVPAQPALASLRRNAGESHGYYFQQADLNQASQADPNLSTWRVLLVAPSSTLFSSVNGARAYVPWIIFVALVVVAILAGLLAWRVIRAAEEVTDVNARLAKANRDLSVANESLQRRAAELARSNEELESFASIASHDLQEPLRKVRTFTEQLTVLEADRLSDKGRDYLTRANSAAERMQNLIEDLLKFSRVSTQGRPFELVDLGDVTSRVLGDLENQVEEAGAVVDVGPLPVITADPLQMQQLLQNLISNAIKFRRPDMAPEVKVRAEVRNGKVHLTVSDNGIGFEPRYAARIFRIFERLHGRTEYPGTGIGLALCRKIADRHGGTIEAESEVGHGATFTVTLPVSQPEGTYGFGAADSPHEEVHTGAAV